jgi:D-glycero-beta-D-manno-heptose-7-phosphate kinase
MFTQEEIRHIFHSFSGLKALVIGDVMVDSYLWGRVERISPEAPVPVVSLTQRENRPGGAANVALNVQALGAVPVLCSVIGDDSRGDDLLKLLGEKNLETSGIIRSSKRLTTTKFRIIGNNSHMLRVDEETDIQLDESDEELLFRRITELLDENTRVVIFEDYDKGVITPGLIKKVAEAAALKSIPVAVDPKKRNFGSYNSVTLFKPNFKELCEGLKLGETGPGLAELEGVVAKFLRERQFEMVMVTLSEAGVFVCYREGDATIRSKVIPAHLRSVSDVSGAGDTVIAVAALGLAVNLNPVKMAALANLAGGLVCEEVGVVPVDRQKLMQEALQKLTTT